MKVFSLTKLKNILPENNRKILTMSFSMIFAFLSVLGKSIVFTGVGADFNNNYIKSFAYFDITVFVVLFVIFYIVLSHLSSMFVEKNKIHGFFKNNTPFFKNKMIFGSIIFCIILFCWLPYLLSIYPGCLLADSLSSIKQATGNINLNNAHPILFTLIIKFFLTIGKILNLNPSASIFLFSFSQTLFFAFTITYFIIWLAKRGVNKYICYLILSYFLFSPVFVFYAVQVQKDTLFSLMCFHIILILGDIIREKENYFLYKKNIIKLLLTLLLIVFFRNNGIYVVILIFVGLFIILPKLRKKILLFSPIFVTIIFVITGPVYKSKDLRGPAVEAYGIPLQQIARTIVYKGKIAPKDLEFINKILPLENFENCYKPCLVDYIKWNSDFDKNFFRDNQAKFLLIWAKNAPQNMKLYAEAFLLNTFGFWAFGEKNSYGYLDTHLIDNDFGIQRTNLLNKWFGINIENYIAKYDYLGSGTLFWILLLSIFLLLYHKKYARIIILLPCFAVWLSIMIATPVAFSLRYVLILALSLPLLLILPLLSLNEKSVK